MSDILRGTIAGGSRLFGGYRGMKTLRFGKTAAALMLIAASATPQGQDSTPARRNLLIMAEMLPGEYDNMNQNYFDGRRKLPESERHPRVHTTITRVEAPRFGPFAFLWKNETETSGAPRRSWRIMTLEEGGAPDEVVMKHYFKENGEIRDADLADMAPSSLRRTDGCDYVFKRRADHFRGRQKEKACAFEWEGQRVYTANEISIARTSLWFNDHKFNVATGVRLASSGPDEPFWMERARTFHCYVDVPGVGGGRDIPFARHDDITLHDKGGTAIFKTREEKPREVYLRLQAVTWHVLNEANDNFNRNSLVLYAYERAADGSTTNGAYAFTDPDATRIGVNLGWMLANCAMTKRNEARPEP